MNSPPTPLVSVVMPVYNGLPHLREAIASVLAQTYPAVELVIVDDGSTDGSAEVAEALAPAAVVIRQENQGQAAARNRALIVAKGEFIAFLDADDLALPERLARQVEAVQEAGVDAAFCHLSEFRALASGVREVDAPRPALLPTSCLVTRAAAARIGPFQTSLRVGEFVDWWARGVDLGLRSVMVPELLAERRLHAGNTGRTRPQDRSDFLKVIRAARDRRAGQ